MTETVLVVRAGARWHGRWQICNLRNLSDKAVFHLAKWITLMCMMCGLQQLLMPAEDMSGISLNWTCLTVFSRCLWPIFSMENLINRIFVLDMLMNRHFPQLDKYAGSCIFQQDGASLYSHGRVYHYLCASAIPQDSMCCLRWLDFPHLACHIARPCTVWVFLWGLYQACYLCPHPYQVITKKWDRALSLLWHLRKQEYAGQSQGQMWPPDWHMPCDSGPKIDGL